VLMMEHDELANADGWMAPTQYELVEMLTMSLPTIQCALHSLTDLDLIEIGYGRIRILAYNQMKRLLANAKN